MEFLYNNKGLKNRRKQLRNSVTAEEKILWSCLRNKQLGVRFRRQYSIAGFILDFYCPEKRLGIELDGSQHLESREYDRRRTIFIEEVNIHIIRFWNNEIRDNLTGVLVGIEEILRAR